MSHAVDDVLQLPADWTSGRNQTVQYGEGIGSDPCLMPLLERERFFLNKLIPRHEKFRSIAYLSCATWGRWDMVMTVSVLAVFAISTAVCSGTNNEEEYI